MPVISFSTLRNKILSGEKRQTIRPKRSDYWLRFSKGDSVYGYWKLRSGETEKLFESELSEDPFVVKWKDFDDELMARYDSDKVGKAKEILYELLKRRDALPTKNSALDWIKESIVNDPLSKKIWNKSNEKYHEKEDNIMYA